MKYENKNRIIFDWLNFTSKIHTPNDLKLLLGLGSVGWKYGDYGRYFYKEHYSYNGITIYFNGSVTFKNGETRDLGVMVEMSGNGCRTYDTEGVGDYDRLFEILQYYSETGEMKLTRLDVAFDEREGDLNISDMFNDCLNGNYVSNWRTRKAYDSNGAKSVSHGSREGGFLVRIYDKAKQLEYDDLHWIRVELELHNKYALNFVKQDIKEDIGGVFRGVLANNLRYVIPNENDVNRSRWITCEYWEKFLDGAEKVRLYSKEEKPYLLSNVVKHIKNQLRPLRVFLDIFGVSYLQKLIKEIDLKDTKYLPILTDLPKSLDNELNIIDKFTDKEIKLLDDYLHGSIHDRVHRELDEFRYNSIFRGKLDFNEEMNKYKKSINNERVLLTRKIC